MIARRRGEHFKPACSIDALIQSSHVANYTLLSLNRIVSGMLVWWMSACVLPPLYILIFVYLDTLK